jgi:hypothetical protein
MAGSNLTGTFIANTFQKLIQVDSQYGATGSDVAFTQNDLVTTSKYSLLNGLGNKISAIAVESGSTGSGIFLKNTTIDPGDAWGISTLQADPFNGNVEVGLSFWRPSPSTSPNLHKLFLKNTGTTWIGYEGLSGGSPGTGIVTDVATYSLYVKDGIQVGQNTTGNNGRINLIGANPLENGAGMFINGEYPFRTLRYKHSSTFEFDRTRRITDSDNTTLFSVNEWSAHVTGIFMNSDVTTSDAEGLTAIMINDSGSWAIKFNIFNDTNAQKSFVIDVLLIRKGFYDDLRNLDGNQINAGGTDTNPWEPIV